MLGRTQYAKDDNPETMHVVDARFNGDIMVINVDSFDSKIHKRVNSLGQLLDDRGRVLPESMPKSQRAQDDDAPAKDTKSTK